MLQSLNLMEYSEVFQREQLSLDDIKDMDKEDLKLIGISRHKQRQAILKFFSDRSSEEQKADGEQVKQRKLQKETEEQRNKKEAEEAEAQRIEEERKQENQKNIPGIGSDIMLTSSGPSAEWQGSRLGVFEYLQQYAGQLLYCQYNNCPAYRQKHTIEGTEPYYLYYLPQLHLTHNCPAVYEALSTVLSS